MDDIKYVSFKDTSLNEKVASLHTNNMNDIPVWFESLIGINTQDKANFKGENNNMRNLLLSAKHNNTLLFGGVE